MGYTTEFKGTLKFNKQLSLEDKTFLEKLANTRRMARNIEGYGVEGEFYVDGEGMMGQDHEDSIIDYNVPPKTQPSLWLQWTPTEDGWGLEWDGSEKFYNYVEWLVYLIENILAPRGYVLNGEIEWSGEEDGDIGKILVSDNRVSTSEGVVNYIDEQDDLTRVFFVTDGPINEETDNNQNEELFETLEAAEKYIEDMYQPRIRVCLVRHAYRQENGGWNYDDLSDTFETLHTIVDNYVEEK